MFDKTLLDGNVEDVKAGLVGLDATALAALLAAEEAGKTRTGVLSAIKTAQAHQSSQTGSAPLIADVGPASVEPATSFDPSGAPDQVVDIDLGHPALDADPRANTTEMQNRIDFNDPSRDGFDVVTDRTQAE